MISYGPVRLQLWEGYATGPSNTIDYIRKLNIIEKEVVRSLSIVYGELDQDGTPVKSGISEVTAKVNF